MTLDNRDIYNSNNCNICNLFVSSNYKQQTIAYRIEKQINKTNFIIVANRNSNKTGIFAFGKKIIMFDEFISIEKIMDRFKMIIVFS